VRSAATPQPVAALQFLLGSSPVIPGLHSIPLQIASAVPCVATAWRFSEPSPSPHRFWLLRVDRLSVVLLFWFSAAASLSQRCRGNACITCRAYHMRCVLWFVPLTFVGSSSLPLSSPGALLRSGKKKKKKAFRFYCSVYASALLTLPLAFTGLPGSHTCHQPCRSFVVAANGCAASFAACSRYSVFTAWFYGLPGPALLRHIYI